MLLKPSLIAIVLALLAAAVGCTGQVEIREVEVTREVEITREVPVTVETVKTAEVTREVPVVQEVPVTVEVEVERTVEVTRVVAVPQTVEVTREVPVTLAAVSTPTPAVAPTVRPADTPTATPAPTMTPTVSVTPAPTNGQLRKFLSWEMQHTTYGDREIFKFRNTATDYHGGGPAPILTYWCDTRSGRAMYINWHRPITAAASNFPSSSNDPFSQYRDIPFYALVEYADDLLRFVDDLRLSNREQREFHEIWDRVQRRWFIGPETPPALTDDPTPGALVDLLENRNHHTVDIELDFREEKISPDQQSPYGPPSLATISADWIALSDRTQINAGSLGELRREINQAYSPQFTTGDTRPVMTATVKGPDQPAIIVAKWDIAGIRQVLSHCRAIRL